MLTQTIAIFVDAYRELNAKKLFWITLAVSGVIVAAFAGVGISDRGISAFGIYLGPLVTTAMVPRDLFYKYIFAMVGVPIWLTWGATILALVSTAGIMPEFVTGGAIDVVLSKPIGRLRLFLTKYASALTFVGLQALVFSTATFFVIGLRGDSWEPKVFLAVPLVLAMFSFIYCVCALVGLLTRSTIAALLAAIGFWILVFAVNATESTYLMFKVGSEQTVVGLEAREASLRADLAALEARAAEPPAEVAPLPTEAPAQGFRAALANAARRMVAESGPQVSPKEDLEQRIRRNTESLEKERKSLRSLQLGHSIAFAVKTVLPKTSETIRLLSRSMLSMADMEAMQPGDDRPRRGPPRDPDDPASIVNDDRAQQTVERLVRERSVWWVLGTSLLFEAIVVSIAARVFCRRDF